MEDRLIYRREDRAQDLITNHPAKIHDRNKKIVYRIACPPDSKHRGNICVSRWQSMNLDLLFSVQIDRTEIISYPGYFTYASTDRVDEVAWHVNFADAYLFFAYGGRLFAQDEMQVAEHPALASVREALLAAGLAALTVDDDRPTPIVISGVERRCAIATNPDDRADRPLGLYGNNFARASRDAIALATQKIDPPTISNIIAIEAPQGGVGKYTKAQIEYILTTAVSGFAAAKSESIRLKLGRKISIHTGFWGCGAFGGNRVLMALLQLLAANLAGIDRLVFYTGEDNGDRDFNLAKSILERDLSGAINLIDTIDRIESMDFIWGTSNGT